MPRRYCLSTTASKGLAVCHNYPHPIYSNRPLDTDTMRQAHPHTKDCPASLLRHRHYIRSHRRCSSIRERSGTTPLIRHVRLYPPNPILMRKPRSKKSDSTTPIVLKKLPPLARTAAASGVCQAVLSAPHSRVRTRQ
jgi:hypothetical protein